MSRTARLNDKTKEAITLKPAQCEVGSECVWEVAFEIKLQAWLAK